MDPSTTTSAPCYNRFAPLSRCLFPSQQNKTNHKKQKKRTNLIALENDLLDIVRKNVAQLTELGALSSEAVADVVDPGLVLRDVVL